ncbi:MAG: hypothetical protein KGJ09_07125 [Candidatus Omnitrophica bacterium]|nr:hypothetical protein [Candidatus Omnitrophota bacterium]
MSRQKGANRNEDEEELKARKGLVPWSTKEFYEVFAKYAAIKRKSRNAGVQNTFLVAEVLQKQYPNRLEFMAHMYRFRVMRDFLFKYGRQLVKEGLAQKEGETDFRPELMDSLCALPYSAQEIDQNGDKVYTFSYSEVKALTLKKMNAHLN